MRHVASIVVNYNSGAYLAACVDTLLASRFATPVEHTVYVVDNCSSDDSLRPVEERARGEPALRIIRNEDNIGFAAANNLVLAATAADYFVLTNPDCRVGEGAIADVIAAMARDETLAVGSCAIYNADGTIQKTCKRNFPTPGSGLVRILGLSRLDPDKFKDFDRGAETAVAPAPAGGVEYVEAISGAFFCISKSALDKIGLLDDGYFMHCEDLDYCMRAKLKGFHVGFVAGPRVVHAKGVSARTAPVRVLWYLHKGMARFYKKFYQKDYPLLVTGVVYLGIAARFAGKALIALGARLLPLPRAAGT